MSFPMDPARTAPFVLGDASSKSAVLLLHGFTGSPWEVRPLGEALAARGHFVHCPRLPGHGTVPEAMLWVGWRDWVEAAQTALDELDRFERVSVAGLSMGALLALIVAARRPARVSKLVLLAPVMKLQSPMGRLAHALRHSSVLDLTSEWIVKTTTDISDEAVRRQAPLLERYPRARVLDLFTLQDVARLSAPAATSPTLVMAAGHDHVVAFSGVERLHRLLPTSRLLVAPHSWHILPRDVDRAMVMTQVSAFLEP